MQTIKNIKNVGSYITKSYFEFLTYNFQENFPNIINAVSIPSDLIHQTLQISKEVIGIQFIYGLKDALNPNSISIFLVPCVNTSKDLENYTPLVSKHGYYNHEGNFYQLTEVAEMMHNFVRSFAEGIGATYKKANRGIYFGRRSLLDILNTPSCSSIKFHLGVNKNTIPAVLQTLDQLGNAIPNIYMDFGNLDPDDIPDGPGCAATLAVETLSNAKNTEEELDIFRKFRDTSMMDYLHGGMLYEMYYFISPFVTSMIAQHSNREALLRDLYKNAIMPFKELVQNGEKQEALFLLKDVLDELVQTYQISYELV